MSTTPPLQDHYQTLGVARDANISIIKSAHRKLVLTCHPDKFLDEAIKAKKAEEFHRVQTAYETLSDDKKRERHDAELRLAELKAERLKEEGSTRRKDEPLYSPRPQSERGWTGNSQPIFEEIRPRFYQEPRSADPRYTPRYEDYRPRARDYDDYDDFIPAHGTSKKGASSARPESRQEDISSRVSNKWKSAAKKASEKAKEKEYEDRRKSRDKGRRDDGASKRSHNRLPSDGDSVSDTDPEVEAFMSSSTYTFKKSERPRSYEEEKHRSRRKHESRGSSPDSRETKTLHNFHSAAEYIMKSSGKSHSERESRRRPSISRGQSSSRSQQQAPVPPPPPPPPVPEDLSRSRRGGMSKSSSKSSKQPVEIVEPPRSKRDHERPHLTSTASSTSTLKPLRSSTLDSRGSGASRRPIQRSATTPLTPLSSTAHSSKSKRDHHDSGYSSPVTPDIPTPRTTKTSYRIVESGSDSDGVRPQFVVIDPDRRTTRESSPRTSSYRHDHRSNSSRHGPSRSHTLDEPSAHRPPTLGRSATERPSLFGEIPRASPEPRDGPRVRYPDVTHSPRFDKSDINFTKFPRRTSPSERDSRNDHRDAYGDYPRRGSMPHRSGRVQQEV